MLSVRRAPLLSTLYPARCMSRSDQWFARVACPISVSDAAISDRSSPPAAGGNHGVPGTQTACSNLDIVDSQAMKPENLAVIGHIGDLLVDIDTTKCDVHLHFTAVLHTPDREPRLHGELAPPSRRRAPLQQSKGRDLYNWRSTGNCDYNNWRSHHAKLSGDLETGQSQLQPTNN